MMLTGGGLRVTHVSTHCSLREAIERVKRERVLAVIKLTQAAMLQIGIEKPRIAVAGLNPHAGECGMFGREEIEEIEPAVQDALALGYDVSGPIPADTVFFRMLNGAYDAVVVMYHDQGHIPLKSYGFYEGVNITLGLPIIRTSVDHGTNFGKAGKGTANPQSLIEAMRFRSAHVQNEAVVAVIGEDEEGSSMATEVIMPKLGLTMSEGSVVRWLKKDGETVKKGEPMFEVQTDKVVLEVEAPCGRHPEDSGWGRHYGSGGHVRLAGCWSPGEAMPAGAAPAGRRRSSGVRRSSSGDQQHRQKRRPRKLRRWPRVGACWPPRLPSASPKSWAWTLRR